MQPSASKNPLLRAVFKRRIPGGPVIEGAVEMPAGCFSVAVLFGPSGSGKTSVLRCLAGLDRPDEGTIALDAETWFDAARAIHVPPQRRGVGYLPQDYALFPHLTVFGNVSYGLGALDRGERHHRTEVVLGQFGLQGLRDRYPRQLSGGEQQRTALARALVRRPRLLLLDEPLSALDAATREQLRRELRQQLAGMEVPTVLVTHDRVEALALGDTIVVMHDGKVRQAGTITEVFARPADAGVARSVGVDTIEPAEVLHVADGLATLAVGKAQVVAVAAATPGSRGFVCIRGEDVILEMGAVAGSARNRLRATIQAVVREGPLVRVTLDCGFPLTALVTHRSCAELGLEIGAAVVAVVKAPAIHFVPRG